LDDDQKSSRGGRRDRDPRFRWLVPDRAPYRVCLEAIATLRRLGASAQCRSSRSSVSQTFPRERTCFALHGTTPRAAGLELRLQSGARQR
jgi:hypothetical protein